MTPDAVLDVGADVVSGGVPAVAGRPRGFALLVAALVAVSGVLLLALRHATDARFGRLLALASVSGLALAVVWWREWRHGRFDPTNPVVLLSLVFFLPSFVVGSGMVAAGWARPAYLSVADDAASAVAVAQLLAMLGLLMLWGGYHFAPLVALRRLRRIVLSRTHSLALFGKFAASRPRRAIGGWFVPLSCRAVLFDGCCLLLFALVASLLSFLHDPAGHQSGAAEGSVALLRYAGGLSTPGAFLVWLVRQRRPSDLSARAIRSASLLLLAVVMLQAALSGSRGSALTIAMAIGLAAWFTRSSLRVTRRSAAVVIVGVVVVAGGVLFGSTYRAERQSTGSFADDAAAFERPGGLLAAQQYRGLDRELLASLPTSVPVPFAGTPAGQLPDAGDTTGGEGAVGAQLDLTARTWQAITDRGLGGNISYGVDRLVERLDQVASFAVVVDRRDELAAREQALGLDTGLPEQLAVTIIPRAVWPGKPIVGDIRTLSGLYFEDDSNSYAITAMGDLLRQYGPFGVAVGMVVLGMFLRVLHGWLVRPGWAPYRWALFVAVLLRATNLEGFYSVIYADMLRMAAVVLAALFGAGALRAVLQLLLRPAGPSAAE